MGGRCGSECIASTEMRQTAHVTEATSSLCGHRWLHTQPCTPQHPGQGGKHGCCLRGPELVLGREFPVKPHGPPPIISQPWSCSPHGQGGPLQCFWRQKARHLAGRLRGVNAINQMTPSETPKACGGRWFLCLRQRAGVCSERLAGPGAEAPREGEVSLSRAGAHAGGGGGRSGRAEREDGGAMCGSRRWGGPQMAMARNKRRAREEEGRQTDDLLI